jgi:hypothetical protein
MEERRNKPEFDSSPTKWRYNFTKSFFTFWKTVKMYGGENERIDEEITLFTKILNFFFKEKEEIGILFDGIDVKIDKVRIRGRRQDDKYFEDIYDLFLSLCMSGVVFKKGVTEKEILTFFRITGKYPVGREPKVQAYERLKSELPDFDKIDTYPYDPEESGNLPIYTVSQSLRRIYRNLAGEYLEYKKMIEMAEAIPLRIVERNVQDLISIANENMAGKIHNYMLFLASIQSYKESFKGSSAVTRTILSVLTALKLGCDKICVKRTGISAYFQYLSRDLDKGYMALSRMDEFNYSRIEAALNSSFRITDFTDDGLIKENCSSGSLSGEILKVVSYYDNVTKVWPERVGYTGPLMSRQEALRQILKNSREGVFKKEIANAFASVIGVYPCGSLLKTYTDDKLVISGGRFRSFSDESTVFVLNENLELEEVRVVKGETLVDIPDSAGIIFPSALIANILNRYVGKDDKPEKETEKTE